MRKFFSLFVVTVFFSLNALSQDCTIFIPGDVGTELHYEIKNAKGKLQAIYSQKIISIKENGDETVFELLQTHKEPKDSEKVIIQDTISFRCKGNEFYIDMEKYLNQKQMEGFKNMEIKLTTDDLMYPSKLSPGMDLKDGSISLEVGSGLMNMTTNIINRKVEAFEKITTPAGSFKCYKISEDVKSKVGFIKVNMRNVAWIIQDIGTIRSESYNKRGKLNTVTELVKIVRN
ncbi:TapB family protein [Ancylomarina sp. YFZ004]